MTSPKSNKGRILCNCPQCGKDHVRYMNWTGRTILFGKLCKPRIVCEKCNTLSTVELTTDQSESVPLLFEKFGV